MTATAIHTKASEASAHVEGLAHKGGATLNHNGRHHQGARSQCTGRAGLPAAGCGQGGGGHLHRPAGENTTQTHQHSREPPGSGLLLPSSTNTHTSARARALPTTTTVHTLVTASVSPLSSPTRVRTTDQHHHHHQPLCTRWSPAAHGQGGWQHTSHCIWWAVATACTVLAQTPAVGVCASPGCAGHCRRTLK